MGARGIWWVRGAVALGLLLFFGLPYRLTAWIPIWLPFLAALAVEAQFFLSGRRATSRRAADRGPQLRDLDERRRSDWTLLTLPQGAELWIDPGELDEDEVAEWVRSSPEVAALPPGGQFEVGPLRPGMPAAFLPLAPAGAGRRLRDRIPWRSLAVSTVVLLVVAGALALRPTGWERLSAGTRHAAEARFSRLAGEIAGHRVTVTCDTGGRHVGVVQETDGLAEVGGRQAWLSPDICLQLVDLRDGDLRPDSESAGHAVVVLAHEAWHLHGVANEGLANCFAYQSGVQVAEGLGVSPGTARAQMKTQLAENPVEFSSAPAYLVPAGCHDGGAHDLHPSSHRFP